jgi:hypothetical protein
MTTRLCVNLSGRITFLPGLTLLCLALAGCTFPVLKMPQPLPDIVKEYKSVTVPSTVVGEFMSTGVQVRKGDTFTILAKGEIGPVGGKGYWGPVARLTYRFGERGFHTTWGGDRKTDADESGFLYLGVAGPLPGSPAAAAYRREYGFFTVDIILWRREDLVQQVEFLEELRRLDPSNMDLVFLADVLAREKEIWLAEKQASREVEESKEAITALTKAAAPTQGDVADKEKQIAELTERLQKALQALKNLEELKRQLAAQEVREQELTARLARMQAEQPRPAPIPPVIAIATPQGGAIVEHDTVALAGVAEHATGIARVDILVNGEVAKRSGRPAGQVAGKDPHRAEFSERVRLREGKNEIAVVAHSAEGHSAKKTLSIEYRKRPTRVWAVIIGINRYKHLPRLRFAVNDAQAFHRYLVEVNGVPREQIWLLLDEEATLDRIRSVLGTQLRRQAEKDDMVIVFLAGHGTTERDASSLDGDGLEKYILPHNADPKDLYATGLPMNEIARVFQRLGSERLVFITDTCYSGASGGRTIPVTGTRASLSGAFLDRLSRGKGRVILAASDANEVSAEKEELQHGVFTYYLLEALRGKADFDGDGVITVDEVYRYVSDKVPLATGQEQHPVKKGEMTGQIVLGLAGNGERRAK